ncbi:MAG: sigma-70 family RNA polymerase sigma factor [Lachnospiraceae bacterium]|nr:sigma-70 family RNA polymerase sigma factor [Lachnospiraceae bacterium]
MFQYLLLLETEEEKEFFKSIYKKYRDRMFYTAVGILKNESDAEDIVHEVFLVLVDHLDKIMGREPYEVWSYINTTVRRRAYNLCKRKNIQEDSGLEEWQQGEIFEKGLDKELEKEELKEAMAGLLKNLKSSYKEVLILQYYHEVPVQEIAEELGTTPDNVRHISMRAKRKLQDILEERGLWNEKG